MTSPFPGMDPYLESSTQWSDLHTRFINVLSEVIADRLPNNYFARLGEDVWLIQPDPSRSGGNASTVVGGVRREPMTLANIEYLDPHTQAFIEIVRLPEQQVVTVLELLSPTNKTGDGRGFYLEKRQQLLRQQVHIVELDLLRAGRRLTLDRPLPPADYYALVSRANRRPDCEVYFWTVREPLPLIPVPLLAPDADVELDLGEAFRIAYLRGHYDRLNRYNQLPPPPSFAGDDAEWVARTAATTSL